MSAPTYDRSTRKVAVVGAGSVGATLAYACLVRGSARRLALYDIDAARVAAETLDLQHGMQFTGMADIEGSDDIAVCADADVVVVTAGPRQRPGQSRLELAGATVSVLRDLMPKLVEVAPRARYLMITNPVDVTTYAALRISGLPPQQLFGSGTVLDSSRLRHLIAARLDVAVQNVHAYIVGEHGDSEIALWSSATVGGVPLGQWRDAEGAIPVDREAFVQISRDVADAAYRIIAGKGSTYYAIGLCAARIIEAVLNDDGRVLPVTSLLAGIEGVDDVCLSMPSVVGWPGVRRVLRLPLAPDEHAGLVRSAEAVRAAARAVGF